MDPTPETVPPSPTEPPDANPTQVRTKIPLKQIADSELPRLYPQLTEEQVALLRAGRPIGPSMDRLQFQLGQADYMAKAFATTTASMYNLPPVACILAFSDNRQIRRGRKAIVQFQRQTYPRKQLVIVNTAGATLLDADDVPGVKEILLTKEESPTHGRARNLAIASVRGTVEFVVPHWDADALYSPHYLAFMAMLRAGTVLTHQVRIDRQHGVVCVANNQSGVANTAFMPLSADDKDDWYDDVTGGEEDVMWARRHGSCQPILNSQWPLDTLKMMTHGEDSPVSREAFLGPYAAEEHKGRWFVVAPLANSVEAALAEAGVVTHGIGGRRA